MANCCEIVAQLASGRSTSSVYYGMQDKPVSQGLYLTGGTSQKLDIKLMIIQLFIIRIRFHFTPYCYIIEQLTKIEYS